MDSEIASRLCFHFSALSWCWLDFFFSPLLSSSPYEFFLPGQSIHKTELHQQGKQSLIRPLSPKTQLQPTYYQPTIKVTGCSPHLVRFFFYFYKKVKHDRVQNCNKIHMVLKQSFSHSGVEIFPFTKARLHC